MDTFTDTSDMRKAMGVDALLALSLTAFSWLQLALIPAFIERGGHGGGPVPVPLLLVPKFATPTWLSYVLVAVIFLPLAWRRRFPLSVLAIVTVLAGVFEVLPQPPVMTILAPLVALYTVGTIIERRKLLSISAAVIVAMLAFSLPRYTNSRWLAEAVRITATFAVAASLGDSTRLRRAYVAEVEQRALDAERTRDEVARRRVEEERLRIARELHDITAHSLSIIAVQAGAAEKLVERNPDKAREALRTIRATSKDSLDELRSMLGVLRGSDDDAPFAPTSGLARLPELVAAVEAAGVGVESHVSPELGDLPAYADLSAYRIVQEALTNVVRHAHATHVSVSVTASDDALTVEVTDDGSGSESLASAPVEGHGIAGMRERVAALGGEFEAGPCAPSGFRVLARFPVTRGA